MSRAAGLKPVRLALKCDAIAALLADITQRRDGPALGVCVGASSTEFVVIERGRIEAARILNQVYTGAHLAHPAIRTGRGRELRITSQVPLDLELDGEYFSGTDMLYTIRPGLLPLLVR